MSIRLTMGFGDNPRVMPLKDGTVKPDSIELEFRESRNLFYHNLAIDDLDCSEMSISETILARERTDGTKWDWAVAPIFMSRAYGWTDLCVNHSSGIETLADLKGKPVAVPDYDMTAVLWLRCTLKDLYGIEASDITWYNIRTKGESHGLELALEKDPPPRVTLNWFTAGMDAAAMLDSGELDAVRGLAPSLVVGNPRIRRLLPDGGQAMITEHYRKIGVLQTNHHVIIQNRVVREHPWVPMELYKAFQRAKEVSYRRARQQQSSYLYFPGNDFREQASVFGEDPYPFGIQNMRPMLERLFLGSLEQGLIRKPITVEDVYYPTTLGT